MSLENEIKQALKEAGQQLKHDLWKPEDDAFLVARAKDIAGLNLKAAKATDPNKKRAYQAAALDTLQGVKMLALIRAEVSATHIVDALGRFFMLTILPALAKLVPALLAAF